MIRELLIDKTKAEKSEIKSAEIAKLNLVGEYDNFTFGLHIEIISLSKIKVGTQHGIEMIARAWKDGKTLGFGKDGSVEIERFRFYSPPIMTADGTKSEVTRRDGTAYLKNNLKEDPITAVKNTLAHIIHLVGKQDTKITVGKIGNTTSTFYTADAAGGDARIDTAASSSWDTSHDSTDGSYDGSEDAQGEIGSIQGGVNFVMPRGFYFFNTGAISATDTISSATFSLFVEATTDGDNDAQAYISVVQTQGQNVSSDTNLVTGDIEFCGSAIDNPTEGVDVGTRADITGISTSAYLDFALNATGIGWIARSGEDKPVGGTLGITYLGAREGHDIEDVAVAGPSVTSRINPSHEETAGSDQDPKLVVVHAGAAAGPANLKTYNTNATANIKTINTNAIANVKTLDTNA